MQPNSVVSTEAPRSNRNYHAITAASPPQFGEFVFEIRPFLSVVGIDLAGAPEEAGWSVGELKRAIERAGGSWADLAAGASGRRPPNLPVAERQTSVLVAEDWECFLAQAGGGGAAEPEKAELVQRAVELRRPAAGSHRPAAEGTSTGIWCVCVRVRAPCVLRACSARRACSV